MRSLRSRIKALSSPGSVFWIGAVISSSVGVLLYFATVKLIERDVKTRFADHAHTAQNTITARIKSYRDLLRATGSMFQTRTDLSRQEFHDYVAGLSLKDNFPAIESVNFAQYVRDEDRPEFDRQMRTVLAAIGRDPAAYQVKPPGRRPDYSLIKYVEPPGHWETFGMDMNFIPHAVHVMRNARDTGDLRVSGRPIPAISGLNRTGLGMRMPLYRPGLPLRGASERRRAYFGSVGIAFNVRNLVNGVLDEMPIKGVRMTLVDTDNEEGKGRGYAGRLLFDSGWTAAMPAPPVLTPENKFIIALPIVFNGREWRATFSTDKRQLYTELDEYFPFLSMAAGFITSLLFYALFQTLSSSRRRAIEMARAMTRDLRDSQARLQLSHQQLRRLAAHAENIKEGERKRIAREIHDDLGQNLLALRIEADMLAARTSGRQPRLHARACATLGQIDATIKSVRQIINDLRPNVLDLGLSAAVEWQVSEFRRRTGIACELIDDHQSTGLDDRCATAFFRVLQESLSNIVRHACASAVRIELRVEANALSMTVTDNGVGLQPAGRSHKGSFGLVGIEERISILGGSSTVTSCPGAGTAVYVAVPLKPQSSPPLAMAPASVKETGAALA